MPAEADAVVSQPDFAKNRKCPHRYTHFTTTGRHLLVADAKSFATSIISTLVILLLLLVINILIELRLRVDTTAIALIKTVHSKPPV